MAKRDPHAAVCPLCGARLSPAEVLDAGCEILSLDPHLLAGRCPHCQGYLELRPAAGQLQIGYTDNRGEFAMALTLEFPGLSVEVCDSGNALDLATSGRTWRFME